MSRPFGEVLTHAEVQVLIERNNRLNIQPEYVKFTRDDLHKPATLGDLLEMERPTRSSVDYILWQRQLNSKVWRVQPKGANTAYVVERPVRRKDGWTFVPLNARA